MTNFKKFEEISIHYNNIHPSKETKNYIETMMGEVFESSPYGSVLTACLSDRRGIVKGTLKINSSAGTFFTSTESNDLNEVARKLAKQIRRHLDKWKDKRFRIERNKYIGHNVA
jgi:hypothetical protein